MESIKNLIKKLTSNPKVVGLLEYGGARYQDEEIHGDYDLFVFLTAHEPDVESIHFYIDSIPVDLNLRTLANIQAIQRVEGFDMALLDGRIIYDLSGRLETEIRALRERHEKSDVPELSQETIGVMRHGGRHTMDKLRNGRYASTILGRYLLHQVVYWALREYFSTRNLPYKGEKRALNYLRMNEPELYDYFEQFYNKVDFDQQMQLAKVIDEKALEPIGGTWKDNEILTFGNPVMGQKVFKELLGII